MVGRSLLILLAGMVPAFGTPLVSEVDRLYDQRTTLEANLLALSLYKDDAALAGTGEAQWKAARAAWWAGTRSLKPADALRYFKQGMDWGRQALDQDPESAEAHFWLASNLLSYGNAKGAWTSLRLIRQVRAHLAQVLARNPAYLGGGADRILGILDYKIPGFVGGNAKRGFEHLQRALRFDPDNPVTWYYVADYHASQKDPRAARDALARLYALTPSKDFEPEYALMLEQAKVLEKKLGG